MRKLLIGLGLLLAATLLAGLLVQSWLQSDGLRATLEAQASRALGIPIRIASARATFLPRLGVELLDVNAGDPPKAHLNRVSIATGLNVLWTRRVEAADVQLAGGRLDVGWLMQLAGAAASLPAESAADSHGAAPITIVSVRSIRLRDIIVTAKGTEIPVDLDASLEQDRMVLASVAARLADQRIEITGEISSLAKREAQLDVRADVLPVSELMAAVNGLTSGGSPASSSPADSPTPFRLTASITAPVALLGDRRAETFSARLQAMPSAIVVEPVTFALDGGRFEMRLALDEKGLVETRGRVNGLDVARLLSATSARTERLTGQLNASFSVRAPPAAEVLAMLDESRGSIDLEIRDGRMPGIERIREAVLRFADRAGPPPNLQSSDAFTRLDTALSLQPGTATVSRLTMAAADFDVEGHGTLAPRDWRLALEVDVTLSDSLSQQAGRDLYRYARDGRRIVLPAVIGGTLFQPSVTIDVRRATGRAIKNRVEEEVESLFDRLIKKRPRK